MNNVLTTKTKQKILVLICAITLIASIAIFGIGFGDRLVLAKELESGGTAAQYFSGGKGTKAEPYIINTSEELKLFANLINDVPNHENTDTVVVVKGEDAVAVTYQFLNTAYYALGNSITLNDVAFEFDVANGLLVLKTLEKELYLGTGKSAENFESQFYSAPSVFGQKYQKSDDVFIVCSEENFATEWTPIGINGAFCGNFDGRNQDIDGLFVFSESATSSVGLFAKTNGATVTGVNVFGGVLALNGGGIIGEATNTFVSKTRAETVVICSNNAGGIVGTANDGTRVITAENSKDIYGGSSAGGIIGNATNSTVINALNAAKVTSDITAGGIVGKHETLTMKNCVGVGDACAKGENKAGALLGQEVNLTTVTENCYYLETLAACGIPEKYDKDGIVNKFTEVSTTGFGEKVQYVIVAGSEDVTQNGVVLTSDDKTTLMSALNQFYQNNNINGLCTWNSSNKDYPTFNYFCYDRIEITLKANFNGGTDATAYLDFTTGRISGYTAPTRTNYVLSGFYDAAEDGIKVLQYNGDTIKNVKGYTDENGNWLKSDEDITLYAHWNSGQYNVSYYDKGGAPFSGTHKEGFAETHTFGERTLLDKPSRSGFTFDGYYTEINCGGIPITEIEAERYRDEIKVYAKWTLNMPEVTASEDINKIYDGNVVSASVVTNVDGLMPTYKWYSFDGETETEIKNANTSSIDFVNASDSGIYYCRVTVTANGQEKTKKSTNISVKIDPKPISFDITAIEANTEGYFFDGSEKHTDATYTSLVGDDKLSFSLKYELADNVTPINAGNWTVSIASAQITTGLSGNYAIDDMATAQMVISKGRTEIVLSAEEEIFIVYGEQLILPTASANFGIVDVDKTVEEMKNSNVYTVTYSVAGTDNYTSATKPLTINVNKKRVTVTADSITVNEGDTEKSLTYRLSEGLLDGNTISGSLTREKGASAGRYAITQGTLDAGNNYEIIFVGAYYTIKQKVFSAEGVSVDCVDGLPYGTSINITKADTSETLATLVSKRDVAEYYQIGIVGDENVTLSNAKITVVLSDALKNHDEINLIYVINGQTVMEKIKAENGAVVFSVDGISEFVLCTEKEATLLWWHWLLIAAGIAIVLAGSTVITIVLLKKSPKNKANKK